MFASPQNYGPFGDCSHLLEVVGDQQHGHAAFAPEPLNCAHDIPAFFDAEGRRGLVLGRMNTYPDPHDGIDIPNSPMAMVGACRLGVDAISQRKAKRTVLHVCRRLTDDCERLNIRSYATHCMPDR